MASLTSETLVLKGNINHSVCPWCYPNISLEDLIDTAKQLGIGSVELLYPEQWAQVTAKGLTCAMAYASRIGLETGFNDPSLHKKLFEDYSTNIPKAADAGLKNIICFSGNRNGLNDNDGLENCAWGLEPVIKIAEKYKINICIELLNSKVDHPDYQCDHTSWAVKLCEKIGSESLKLLYDIYHMQIMEGDIISTIRKYQKYIAHYHTGGVPGRSEIDQTQELNYQAIMNCIVETGFKGFVAQEFIPLRNPVSSLIEAFRLCDV